MRENFVRSYVQAGCENITVGFFFQLLVTFKWNRSFNSVLKKLPSNMLTANAWIWTMQENKKTQATKPDASP